MEINQSMSNITMNSPMGSNGWKSMSNITMNSPMGSNGWKSINQSVISL